MLDYRADDVKRIRVIKYFTTTNIYIRHSNELEDIVSFDNRDIPNLIKQLADSLIK
jgi:hypothetical protein